jgi:hypothetical protein
MTLVSNGPANFVIYRWTFADATARAALSATAADVGQIARQVDDDSLWLLTDDSPLTWAQIGGAGVTSLDDVGDVNAPSPSDGDVLTWDSTPGEWVAAAPAGGGSGPAGKLGYAQITSSVTTSSTSFVDATGLSVTVTAGGARDVLITFQCALFDTTAAASVRLQAQIYDATASANLTTGYQVITTAGGSTFGLQARVSAPAAGSHTYKVRFMTESGAVTARIYADSGSPAFILVEEI